MEHDKTGLCGFGGASPGSILHTVYWYCKYKTDKAYIPQCGAP